MTWVVSEEQLQRYRLAVLGSHDGVWDWDLKADKIHFSSRWCEIIGFREGELEEVPGSWLARVHPEDVVLLDTAIQAHLAGDTDRLALEYRIRHKNGHYIWVLTRGQAVFDGRGNPIRLVGSQSDVTDRKMSEQLVAFNAFHDPLTGLANRALFMERLQQILIHHKRNPNHKYALMFLDLDKFKDINDNLGHEAGDEILRTVVKRLNTCIRADDTLARFGGDEFVILVSGADSKDDVISLAERILHEMERPFQVHDHKLMIGISIGIVCDTEHYGDADSGIRDADLALYHAKSKGRNRYEIFEPSMKMKVSKHFHLQTTLNGAKDRRELVLFYQPIVSLVDGDVLGFEALMRWKHPESGIICPMDFIPLAEETGLIDTMGSWAISHACSQLRHWQKNSSTNRPLFMCVNTSARQLECEDLGRAVTQAIKDNALRPEQLVIEITENNIMNDLLAVETRLHMLKQLGIRLALDDFGTGYSSLVSLSELPFDILKIAREFITDIHERPKAEKIVKLIQTLAQESKMQAIVEGVETTEELEVLRRLGCTMTQGYLISKPRDADAISEFLASDYKSTYKDFCRYNKKTA